ncbi:methyltransferase domain-containing protein [Sphingomicrobium lutaoense]|uniref:Methyltransferase domain-containing protein n=1 Tax=Sphingomicrobium lutaoense TaxID=515949 RepID=A0A839YVS8_9SPHN|nr:methyltransferase domain-containing protein [Sphingomicrobium lutaoense]MBB3763309.1 hypothetical protein [Sphingomicrobium lutaoense]
MADLFDLDLRDLRRARALRSGRETFLHDRAFEDILDRLALIERPVASILLLGAFNPDWVDKLSASGATVRVIDPTAALAEAAGGDAHREEALAVDPQSFDCIIAIGTLDTVNALPDTLLRLRFALTDGGFLLGAMAGGDSLPMLRSAMRAADQAQGGASPHVHPRIDPASLTSLLTNAGFQMPVVDVDRVRLRYPSLEKLVADLRAMGGTNILRQKAQGSLTRAGLAAAQQWIDDHREPDGKFTEQVEILHFMGWAPE